MDRVETKNEKYFTDELVDLLEGMLQVDPEERLTIREVLNHRYFDKVKKLPRP
jgi:serine/threonine protein kinase